MLSPVGRSLNSTTIPELRMSSKDISVSSLKIEEVAVKIKRIIFGGFPMYSLSSYFPCSVSWNLIPHVSHQPTWPQTQREESTIRGVFQKMTYREFWLYCNCSVNIKIYLTVFGRFLMKKKTQRGCAHSFIFHFFSCIILDTGTAAINIQRGLKL